MVSVIIPVYNVEQYIDRCIESVVNQTYKDIEILVMEAKSTDSSLFRVIEWSRKDHRITVVSRKDGGLGPGRNFGVSIAQGDYLVFIDSDDWIAKDFIEKTLAIAEKDERIDIVQGGIVYCINGELKNARHISSEKCETVSEKKRAMCYGENSIWGKLYKTGLFKETNILQPALPYEDLAVYAALVAKAEKVATCNEAVTYHEVEREGSLFQNLQDYKKFPAVYQWGKDTLKKVGQYDIYRNSFELLMYRHFNMIVSHCIGDERKRDLIIESPEIYEFQRNNFAGIMNRTCWAFGGFSLRWISHHLLNGKEGLTRHFAFTGIIAQMSEGSCREFIHENSFRKNCIQSDIQGQWRLFQKQKQENYPELLVIDFLQECEDVIELEDGNYVTKTVAFKESNYPTDAIKRIIPWNSKEFWELWKEKCNKFIDTLEDFSKTKIVLVKNMFVSQYKEQGQLKEYPTLQIDEKNEVLNKMYSYFSLQCKRAHLITGEKELCFTDVEKQGYEASPEYYNGDYYRKVSESIELYYFDSLD